MRPTDEPRRRRSRRGFTMVEVLLVLALMAALGAIVWPAIDGPFAAERLRAAAEQLQADLVRARVMAIDSGTPHRLQLFMGERRYVIFAEPYGAAPTASSNGSAATVVPLRTGTLPEEIVIREVERSTTDAATAMLHDGSIALLFRPDGTTVDAVVGLSNDRDMWVKVRLRGLTGATKVDDVLYTGDRTAMGSAQP